GAPGLPGALPVRLHLPLPAPGLGAAPPQRRGSLADGAGRYWSDQAAHARVADAGLAVLEVAGVAVLEDGVVLDGDDQVVPAPRAPERPALGDRVAGLDRQVGPPRRVPVRHGHLDRLGTAVLDLQGELVRQGVARPDAEAGLPAAGAAPEAAE